MESLFCDQEIFLLEIGVSQGGGLQMWKDYFGENTKIYGIDLDPRYKELEEDNIEIHIGSQSGRKFLSEVKNKIPRVDILIDDGGHTMKKQKISFEELFNHVKRDGVYLAEDLHTSCWRRWGGGYKRPSSSIEYTKNFIDHLNAFHSKQKRLKVSTFTKSVDSIHYYDSILVIEKRNREISIRENSGELSFTDAPKKNLWEKLIPQRIAL